LGLFSFVGGILGGGSKKKAAQKAADAQIAFAQKGLDESARQFDLSRADQMPWLAAGQGALGDQLDLLGISRPALAGSSTTDWAAYARANPDLMADWQQYHPGQDLAEYGESHYNTYGKNEGRDITPFSTVNAGQEGTDGAAAQAAAIERLKQSPMFQSLMENGQNLILANRSATGGLRGGDIRHDFASFGRDSLAQVIQQQLANLGGISAQGGATGAGLGALGANKAASDASLYNQQGAAKAGMFLTKGAVNANNWNNAGGVFDDVASAIGGGGSFGSILKGLF
jgi:hypothetical protein